MGSLDPFVIQWPDKWVQDPEIGPVLHYLNMYLQNLSVTLDNGDAIDDVSASESFETSNSSAEFHDQVADLEQLEDLIPTQQFGKCFESDVITIDRVITDSEFGDLQQGVTVTFDPNAAHDAEIITANGDGSLVRIVSAIELRYKGQRGFSMNIRNEGTTLHWYMFVHGTEQFWRPA